MGVGIKLNYGLEKYLNLNYVTNLKSPRDQERQQGSATGNAEQLAHWDSASVEHLVVLQHAKDV